MGAVLVILSLAIDPFLQQIVEFAERPSMVNRGTVPRVVNMSESVVLKQDDVEFMSPLTQLMTTIGHFYTRNAVGPDITAYCPNVDCTWPVFDTLAICSSCQDMTAELSFGCFPEPGEWKMNYTSEDTGSHSEPSTSCGWFINGTSSRPMLMTGYSATKNSTRSPQALLMRQLNMRDPLTDEVYWNGSVAFKHIPNPLANFVVAASSDVAAIYANATPTAFECVFHLCTKTIAARMVQGRYEERVVSEYRNLTRRVEPITVGRNAAGLDYLYGQSVAITPPGQNETFFAGNVTMMEMRFSFDRFLPSYLTLALGEKDPDLRFNNEVLPPEGQKSFKAQCGRWLQPGGIEQTVEDMGRLMSIALRSTVHSIPVYGSGLSETYIRLRWAYGSLPAVVLVLTAVLLATTVAQTGFSRSSRKSSLFTLMYGLSPSTRASLEKTHSLHALRQNARNLLVYTNENDDNDDGDGNQQLSA